MQRQLAKSNPGAPQVAQSSKSFSRYEPSQPGSTSRSRSSSLQESATSYATSPLTVENLQQSPKQNTSDIFETRDESNTNNEAEEESEAFPNGVAELPIEIQSLMERFLESLSLKVHPTPLSIERLAELYQDFYEHVQSHINTHIASLWTKISRDQSPSPSISSGMSTGSKGSSMRNIKTPERTTSIDPLSTDRQMLTISEVTDKRNARRLLEVKRLAMEEAVERGICEKVYSKIWRHKTTDDEERDEKLRSRAAALSVVGVDLQELLSSALSSDENIASDLDKAKNDNVDTAKAQLATARSSLESMNAERYPLGKLNSLKSAHKDIVEALQQMFPSSSSADEVLPTLIYTIITSSPESIHVVSNFNFIQRFRRASKIDGEAAYCLTNLEAAVTFLETVELPSIRRGEVLEGPTRSPHRPSTPTGDTPDPLYRALSNDALSSPKQESTTTTSSVEVSSRPRAISNLIHSGTKPLETAGGLVIHSADAAIDNIQSALDSGFKFLFGRMKEKQAASTTQSNPIPATPKTLEDARKLVTPADPTEDDASIGDSSIAEQAGEHSEEVTRKDSDRILELVGGQRMTRERSYDSTRSAESQSKKSVQAERKPSVPGSGTAATSTAAPAGGFAPVESVRSFGSSLNPLKGFTGIGMMRGFGRTSSATPPPVSSSSPSVPPVSTPPVSTPAEPPATDNPVEFSLDGVGPPIQRFVHLKDPRELNFFDVELLLRDYQRLAGAIQAAKGG